MERKKLEEGSFGPVAVWAGEHKGKVGYYDDDQGGSAIIYFDKLFTEYALIQRRWLTPTKSHKGAEEFAKTFPNEAARMGIVASRE